MTRIAFAALLVALLGVGCGPSTPAPTPVQPTPAPAPVDAAPPDAAPLVRTYPDERVGELIAAVEGYGDELCVCRDDACVEALVAKNRATHEELLLPLTDEETERLAAADSRFASCHLRVTGEYPR